MESTLFIPDRHETLSSTLWNKESVRAEIESIVHDTETHFNETQFWPEHPEDDWSKGQPMLSLFGGASSTIWALLNLEKRNAIKLQKSYLKSIDHVYENFLRHPDSGTDVEIAPGLLFGKLGFQLLQFRYGKVKPSTQDLVESIKATIIRPELEMMWGTPGALLACEWLFNWTNEAGWNDLKIEAYDFLYSKMVRHAECDAYLWTQDLYGEKRQYLGAVHGAAGNYQSMLLCLPLLEPQRRENTVQRALTFLENTGRNERNMRNWPVSVNSEVRRYFAQWCHGAVGVVTSLIDPLFERSPELFINAGNLVWAAGPLKKRFGLCHGTAGNGYVFLKLYRHTQDKVWLERARAFAMHALEQSRAEFTKHGRRRFATLTGDLGLALYLQDCTDETSEWPMVDYF